MIGPTEEQLIINMDNFLQQIIPPIYQIELNHLVTQENNYIHNGEKIYETNTEDEITWYALYKNDTQIISIAHVKDDLCYVMIQSDDCKLYIEEVFKYFPNVHIASNSVDILGLLSQIDVTQEYLVKAIHIHGLTQNISEHLLQINSLEKLHCIAKDNINLSQIKCNAEKNINLYTHPTDDTEIQIRFLGATYHQEKHLFELDKLTLQICLCEGREYEVNAVDNNNHIKIIKITNQEGKVTIFRIDITPPKPEPKSSPKPNPQPPEENKKSSIFQMVLIVLIILAVFGGLIYLYLFVIKNNNSQDDNEYCGLNNDDKVTDNNDKVINNNDKVINNNDDEYDDDEYDDEYDFI